MRVIDADGLSVGSGDVLVLRTGFAEMLVEMAGKPDAELLHNSCCALDGRDERLLQWITDSGIAAIAADNYAVERFPARAVAADKGPVPMLPLHHHCLFKLGLPLGELWYLRDGGVAACRAPSSLLSVGAAAAPARRDGIAGHAGGHRLMSRCFRRPPIHTIHTIQ